MKKDYFIKLAILLFPLHIFSQTSITQLTVTANNTATQLAQAITGIGVLITNASLSCGTNGAGTFSYSGSTLGLSNGIILTTGQATDASLPAQIVSVQTGNNFSDPDLTAICTDAKYDACILQFDIVPMGDTMSIKYAFGSSE